MNVLGIPLLFNQGAFADSLSLGNHLSHIALAIQNQASHPTLIQRNVRLESSSYKTRSDYSVEKGCNKLDLIPTIP